MGTGLDKVVGERRDNKSVSGDLDCVKEAIIESTHWAKGPLSPTVTVTNPFFV